MHSPEIPCSLKKENFRHISKSKIHQMPVQTAYANRTSKLASGWGKRLHTKNSLIGTFVYKYSQAHILSKMNLLVFPGEKTGISLFRWLLHSLCQRLWSLGAEYYFPMHIEHSIMSNTRIGL